MRLSLYIFIFLAFIGSINPSSANIAFPFNTQNADITNDGYWNLTFEYSLDQNNGRESQNFTLPNLEIRHGFLDRYRIGLLSSLVLGLEETSATERSAFGFDNLRATFEYMILDNHNKERSYLDYMTLFINQDFPTVHNDLLGDNSYGFETGIELEHTIGDFTFYSELGYRFDNPENGSIFNSFLYNNAIAWNLYDKFQPFVEILGLSSYGANNSTSLNLVTGWVTHIQKGYYVYAGIPIGLNDNSADFGVQLAATGTFDWF